MKLTPVLSLLTVIFAAFAISTTQPGCANMVPPLGGPKDSIPPVLVNVNPADSTRNFAGKKIVLNFNEYIQLADIQKNLLVSPTPKINPTVQHKLKTITVTLRDTLEENTTYSLDFGNAIRDLNEGNPFRNYRYLFSTGRTLDSLTLGGRVVIAETGKPDSTLIAMLYNLFDDSAVVKERPRYIARVDSSGYFNFQNLAPGSYRLYALKDEGARRYLSKDQYFAFYDSVVTSESQRRDYRLYAFKQPDTATKSSFATAESEPEGPKSGRLAKVLKLEINAAGGQQDLLSPLIISVSRAPLKNIDTTKIVLTDTSFRRIPNYSFQVDTSGKKISVVYPWPENTPFNLVIDTAFAEDTLGRRLVANDTVRFTTKRAAEYGLVKMRFLNLPLDRNPVLQFVQGDAIKHTHVFTNNQFFARLFTPGEYELRIVFDENRNGIWDTGQFFGTKRQPEKVQTISRKLTVKANWDNELDIQL